MIGVAQCWESADELTMKVIFPMPTEEALMVYIIQTTHMENLPLEFNDIQQTLNKRAVHPLVVGHLNAIKYVIKMASTEAFPCRSRIEFADEWQSFKNTYWLRDIHTKLMEPISKYQHIRVDLNLEYPLNECGQYRLQSKFLLDGRNAQRRYMPRPGAIKRLLHHWHKEIAEFHLKYLPKIEQRQLQMNDVEALAAMARKAHMGLQCIHPFSDGTARTARLVENLLRLRWGLAWKPVYVKDRLDYATEIMAYEDSKEWQQHLTTMDARQ